MHWVTVADSHIGGREEQQDRYLVKRSKNKTHHLLVVADGAGGHKDGAAAAQTAINYISEHADTLRFSEDPHSAINSLIVECNKRVLLVGDNMACSTLVLVYIRGDELFWGHVGDSRFYLVRDNQIVFQTMDHSVVELQQQSNVYDGEISSSKLYMCLGALENVEPDVANGLAKEGDTLLLCSDGFWGQLEVDTFIAELSDHALTQEFIDFWINKASNLKNGNSDNITLVATRLLKTPSLATRLANALFGFFKKQ